MTMPTIYISGPYRSRSGESGVWSNIMAARQAAIELLRLGCAPICPHLNTMLMGGAIVPGDEAAELEVFLAADFELIRRSDALWLLPGWEKSDGAKREVAEASTWGLPCWDSLPPLSA